MRKKTRKLPVVCVSMDDYHIEVTVNVPVSFKIPYTEINKKFVVVFLRMLRLANGAKACTCQRVADLCGYRDRRDVDNFWREYAQHGYDILAFLSRKVDLVACIPLLEDFVSRNLLLPIADMHTNFMEAHSVKMSLPTFRKYVSQTSTLKVIKEAQKLMYKKMRGGGAVDILRLLASQHKVPVLCDSLLKRVQPKKLEPKRESALRSSLKRQNLCFLVHYLVASGLSLQTISLLLNASKATVSNLWHEIEDLPSIILNSIAKWSGKISIDEKYIKIKNIPHYVITIVDFVTGLPLYLNVYPNTTKESYEECFRTFKLIYKRTPTMIVSDGSYALKAGRLAVYPTVPHQLCKFHKMRNLFGKISRCQLSTSRDQFLKNKVIRVFRRSSVSGRKKGLRELMTLLPQPAAKYVDSNIIKHWKHLSKGLTSNVSERFNRKINKVMSGRYGLKSVETAANLANSLWLKELIDRGKNILLDDSLIANLNISQICQEKLDWKHLDLLFSKNTREVA